MKKWFKNKIKYDLSKIADKSIHNALKGEKIEHSTISKDIEKKSGNKKALIEINNITKSFGNNENKVIAINNLSLKIYENENIAILGGNGAGKTTLVEIIAGLNKPTSGNIDYHLGQEYNFKENIGIQFQDSAYPTGINVKQVITFIRKISKVDMDDNKVNALIEIFGIGEFYNKKASSLSGGQQQRLNCLLSIINNPKFIILDELSTGLDIIIRNRIKEFIYEYAKEHNMTILIISHDMDEVNYIADRIVIMRKGEIYLDMNKKDLIKKYGSITECVNKYI